MALDTIPLPLEAGSPTKTSSGPSYAELKSLIRQKGLLDKHPKAYIGKILLLSSLLAVSFACLLLVHPFWIQLLNAVFLAFISTQLGLLGHDAGHRQIFKKTWKNDAVSLISGNLLIGMSNGWWMDKHNRHHSNPNQEDLDPDINIPFLAFSKDDLDRKSPTARWLMQFQAFFFFPLLLLVGMDLQRSSIRFLLKQQRKHRALEVALLLTHFIGYFSALFLILGPWQAVAFILIHQSLTGLYLGSIFAPNHKGMTLVERESDLDFLHRQVITARNVRATPLIDFWYGGLNFQIEHHLFPSMPRARLREAQHTIKSYCQTHNIPYHETGMVQSYREILSYLHGVGAPLRQQ